MNYFSVEAAYQREKRFFEFRDKYTSGDKLFRMDEEHLIRCRFSKSDLTVLPVSHCSDDESDDYRDIHGWSELAEVNKNADSRSLFFFSLGYAIFPIGLILVLILKSFIFLL